MERCGKELGGVREPAVVESTELIGCEGASTRVSEEARELNEEKNSELAGKRSREVGGGELDFASGEFVEYRSARRRVAIEAAEESSWPADGSYGCGLLTSVEEASSVCEPDSCCFIVVDRSTLDDPAVRAGNSDGRAESAQSETLTFSIGRTRIGSTLTAEKSGDLDSTTAHSCQNSTTEMPSESEIEEFFSIAEKNIQKRFTERYNFDFGKGVPLKGRYEWVPVKP